VAAGRRAMSRTSQSASARERIAQAFTEVAPSVVAMLDQLLLRKRDKEAVAERA